GLYDGTKTVYLYNRSTGALLASASGPAVNGWTYKTITPLTLTAGTSYTVALYTAGSGAAYRTGMSSMPSVLADATIEGTCSRPGGPAEPCASSGLVAGNNYGMADIKYTAVGGGLACPADSLVAAGTVCRAAAGSCDVAETCTGSSPACPANAFAPSGVACNDGALCTYNDVCNGAGSCGGTPITCGGGNACSTTVCNGTNTCDVAKVFCDDPPGECYNTLGACNTANGSCSYTVKVGAPCGFGGSCQSSGACSPPLIAQPTSVPIPGDCATQTVAAPTPIGCDSCDPSHPCVVDSTATVPAEYQTCSGYTPRKGDIVVHDAGGLTKLLVANFGSPWTHIGGFLCPQQGSHEQPGEHQALNLDGLAQSVVRPSFLQKVLIALSFDKSSAYCRSAKVDPATLFDPVEFKSGVPNTHRGDMVTETDSDGVLYWETPVQQRKLLVAANRALAETVADRMAGRFDYYSLNSLVDEAKGRATLSHGKPGTNCASAIMASINDANAAFGKPPVPRTLLPAAQMKATAELAYEQIRRQVKGMPATKSAISQCKLLFGCLPGVPFCPVDCD